MEHNHMSLKQSTNYIWDVADLLGNGACGHVYRGLKKTNADPVAVKVYSAAANQRATEIQLRELSVIKKLKHENIVKLLDIEREERTKKMVIVMELCTGGSLLKILEDPEHCWGLPEDEFLLVLEHVSAGTQYLRQEKVVHRDLKPANIMKFIGDDGCSVYKLIDFDSARELEDNQEFFSLYGTEEYLHPDMYEQYLLPSPNTPTKRFSASNDLWSIGASMYHVATGQLPFRPFQRRKDPKTMHQMTAKKAPGVIAAYQPSRDGKIVYETELPGTCNLSTELKMLITPLLASLMEVDPRKKYTYDQFFLAVSDILERKKVHIFNVNKVVSLRLYLDKNVQNQYDHLLQAIEKHTGVSPDNQILLHKGRTVFSILELGKLKLDFLPLTTQELPIILCSRVNEDVLLDVLPNINFVPFGNVPDALKDFQTSKHNCSVGYHTKRIIEDSNLAAHLLVTSVHTISQVVILHLTTVAKEQAHIQSVVNSLNNQFQMMTAFLEISKTFLLHMKSTGKDVARLEKTIATMEKVLSNHVEKFQGLKRHLSELDPAISSLVGSRVEKKSLINQWEKTYSQIPNIGKFHRNPVSATSVIEKLRSSYQFFSTDSVMTSGQNGNSYYYLLQRMKMNQQTKDMKKIYELDCMLTIKKIVEVFSDWFKNAQAAFCQPEILAKDVVALRTDVTECEHKLEKVVQEFLSELRNFEQALDSKDNSIPSASSTKDNALVGSTKQSAQKLHRHIKDFAAVHQEIRTNSKETFDLCNQLRSLLETSLSRVNQS